MQATHPAYRIIPQQVSAELAPAILEYIDNLDTADRQAFLDQLAASPAICQQAEMALSAMAMLIAAANVIDDESEFEERAESCFADALDETPSILAMRAFYLDNQTEVDMQSVASVPPEIAARRLARWKDYLDELREQIDLVGDLL